MNKVARPHLFAFIFGFGSGLLPDLNGSKVSADMLSEIVGISKRKMEENTAKLKKLRLVERVGGTRGYWEVKV